MSEAIESILAQRYRQFEIIVVDDGSTDNSRQVAAGYPKVKYIHQHNQGVAIARNTGLHASSGDYLVFLDQDDRLLPKALEIGVECLDSHPDYAFVFGVCRVIRANGTLLPDEFQKKYQACHYQEVSNYELLLSGEGLVPPGVAMYRRTILESVGGFDQSYVPASDFELYLRISRSFPIYCHNEVIIDYRMHKEGQSRNSIKGFETVLKVLDAQRDFINANKAYETAYLIGRNKWKKFFGRLIPFQIIRQLKAGRFRKAKQSVSFLLWHYPLGILTFPVDALSKLVQRIRYF